MCLVIFSNVGALAEILDISCISPDDFDLVTDLANDVWQAIPQDVTAAEIVGGLASSQSAFVLGQHYFVPNPSGSGLSPKWDFTSASEAGNPKASVVGAKTGDIPATTDPSVNIDWLSLKPVVGELATQIYRIQTRNGQPPSSVRNSLSLDAIVRRLNVFSSAHPAALRSPSDTWLSTVSAHE